MLRIPKDKLDLEEWTRDIVDECMESSEDRGMIYTRAAQYYYMGSYDSRAAIYNKIKPFVDKLGGFLMQPTDVRFQLVFDSSQPDDVLQRAQLASEMLTSDFRQTDSDVVFSEAVVWSLINGCHILKVNPDGEGFKVGPIHPQNFGVLSEMTLNLDEQEAFCHISYPSVTRLASKLEHDRHPRAQEIMDLIREEARRGDKDAEPPTYLHQMVVGGMQPVGEVGSPPAQSAAGIVNVFPVPSPWRAQRKLTPTVKFCEVWIRDRDTDGDFTTLQMVYPNIMIEGENTRRNLSRVPGRCPFVKIQAQPTPGYFWGRSVIADVQMLQDVLTQRLRDIKVMWDRNTRAPQVFSGFTSVTEEQYLKIISEGGFINDPNPNAKAAKLMEPPPQGYLEEMEFIFKMFDEVGGFSPVMSGQGEPGVRAGVHAQTLVRTSSPRLIDQAARIERQLAEAGYLALRIKQAMDPSIYITGDGQTQFILAQLPDDYQVVVDSHSASPAFAEDNRQVAIALARAGAIDAEDLIHMLHPPGAELLLSRLRQRQKAMAQAQQQEKQEELVKNILGFPGGGHSGVKKKSSK